MSFFSKIFKSEPKLDPISLSVFGADIHSHLIPGIDDGSPDMETSVMLVKKFVDFGFKKIVTTPHVMCDYYQNTPDKILSGLDDLREELQKQNVNVDISAAAEYNLDDGLQELIDKKEILTFGDNHVLFELPFMQEPRNLQEIIFNFQMAGYKPILAHPERYTYWYDSIERYEELKARGVLLQMNLLSLTGHYSPETRKISEKMVDANLIDAVGTDCHRIEHLKAIEHHLDLKHIHKLAAQENLFNKKL
ncbi:MAG: capsular biosynthesis protein [Flavobacteriales bacterium]|nr:MAG: capsular biosynthesis protein [Flavobacteriales bacterium]